MKNSFLFPYKYKKFSGVVLTLALIVAIALIITDNTENWTLNVNMPVIISSNFLQETIQFGWDRINIFDEILFSFVIISGIVYSFSEEKLEDEMVAKIRLDSLVWATYYNYFLLLIIYWLMHGLSFLYVMIVAMCSQLLFFIIRFRYKVLQHQKSVSNEE